MLVVVRDGRTPERPHGQRQEQQPTGVFGPAEEQRDAFDAADTEPAEVATGGDGRAEQPAGAAGRSDAAETTGAFVRAAQPWGDGQLARLYDAFAFDADLPLYRELALAQGGRVLEVACGSGRLLVPLVQAGCAVTGIDISPHMLALTRDKLHAVPRRSGTAELIQADMRTFAVPGGAGRFDLAIIAVKSFAYLTERADQLRCLERVAAHLRPGGLLAIDLLHPRPEWVGAPIGWLRDDLLQAAVADGTTVWRTESVTSTDLARQVRTIRSVYEVLDAAGRPLAKRFVEWPYRFTYRFEAEHLLERAGLQVEAVYGGYAREPLDSASTTMLFLARRG